MKRLMILVAMMLALVPLALAYKEGDRLSSGGIDYVRKGDGTWVRQGTYKITDQWQLSDSEVDRIVANNQGSVTVGFPESATPTESDSQELTSTEFLPDGSPAPSPPPLAPTDNFYGVVGQHDGYEVYFDSKTKSYYTDQGPLTGADLSAFLGEQARLEKPSVPGATGPAGSTPATSGPSGTQQGSSNYNFIASSYYQYDPKTDKIYLLDDKGLHEVTNPDELKQIRSNPEYSIDMRQQRVDAGKASVFDYAGYYGEIMVNFINEQFTKYNEWRGLAAYSSLFLGKNSGFKEWRNKVDKAFCDSIIFGGIDCLAQKACERYSSSNKGSNVLVVVQGTAGLHAAAYVQAERSSTASFENASGAYTQSLYKVTFYASSPDDENTVQLQFHYAGGTYDWYPAPQKITKGGAISANGPAAILKYSYRDYDQVCIVLGKAIATGTGSKVDHVCTPIVNSGITVGEGQASASGSTGTNSGTAGGGF